MENKNIETQTAALVSAPILGDLKGAIAFCDAARATETAAAAAIEGAAPIGFSATSAELELLANCGDAPALKKAAYTLLEFATTAPEYPVGESEENAAFGRYCFTDYSETSAEIRAAFSILRRSLDFLEADFLACETEAVNHLRGEVASFDAMRAV